MENPLSVVNRQILELKKKIQLSEGQRKAHHEECDAERKKNTEKIHQLKLEIKELRKNLAKKPEKTKKSFPYYLVELCDQEKYWNLTLHSYYLYLAYSLMETRIILKCGDVIFKVKGQNTRCRPSVSKVTTQEAVSVLDQQILDLKKKLDLLRHQSGKGRERMRSLAEEYQGLLVQHVINQQKAKIGTPESFHIRSLENQLHRIEMSVAEACHVRRKYRSIRAGLLEDSASYESSLKRLEESIQKQEEEIRKQQEINREAISLRDTTKSSLLKQEEVALTVGKEREQSLQECRRKVEERGKALLSLESKMFPASTHRDGSTGSPTSPKAHSPHHGKASSAQRLFKQTAGGAGDKPVGYGVYQSSSEEEDENVQKVAILEAAFAKLKEATGETNTEDVLKRFQKQRETQGRLTYLRRVAEDEKAKLTADREAMQEELHTSQFAQVCSTEQNMEDIENTKHLIEKEKACKDLCMENLKVISGHLSSIKRKIYIYCQSLQLPNEQPLPPLSEDPEFSLTVLSILRQKLEWVKVFQDDRKNSQVEGQENEENLVSKKPQDDLITGGNVFMIERRPAVAAEVDVELEEDGVGHGKGGPSGPEEIPTRAFLKRQAQLIVDAKARRRFFVVRGPVGAATVGPRIRRDK